ncbi:MAG: ketol-acid reductoisomerase [Spirochaetaceae bacterium]
MTKVYYDRDVNPELMAGKRLAVIGFGSQGHAHALNNRDSGVDVRVGLRPGSKSAKRAQEQGLEVLSIDEAVKWADVVMVLVPDTRAPAVYEEHIAPNLREGQMLMFAHGFNIRYGTIKPPETVDVTMVAPKGPGHRVRETYEEGGGVPALVAVEQDATGGAKDLALSYAAGLGATRAGVLETTFAEETETDLFGEQVVLCGGVSRLVTSAFETLVDAGYQPEIAYFECMHELKLIVDLMYRGGLNYMRYSVSDTAEYGDYVSGPRVINDQTRQEMKKILEAITDGTFASEWIEENRTGGKRFAELREQNEKHIIEEVGARLRKLMPFLNPIEASPSKGIKGE